MDIKRLNEINHKVPGDKSLDEYPYALSDKLFHTKQLFLYSEKVRPGTKASAPHLHKAIDEIIYVTKGTLEAVEGEEKIVLSPGDSVCFRAGSDLKHYLENTSDEEAEFLIFRRANSKEDVVY